MFATEMPLREKEVKKDSRKSVNMSRHRIAATVVCKYGGGPSGGEVNSFWSISIGSA